jgi:hypothetical protein
LHALTCGSPVGFAVAAIRGSAKSLGVQLRSRLLLVVAMATITGCYDSQWGQQKVAQQQTQQPLRPPS